MREGHEIAHNEFVLMSVELTSLIHEFPLRHNFNLGQDIFLLIMSTNFRLSLTLFFFVLFSVSLVLFYRLPLLLEGDGLDCSCEQDSN